MGKYNTHRYFHIYHIIYLIIWYIYIYRCMIYDIYTHHWHLLTPLFLTIHLFRQDDAVRQMASSIWHCSQQNANGTKRSQIKTYICVKIVVIQQCTMCCFLQYYSSVSKNWNPKTTFPWEKNYFWGYFVYVLLEWKL